MLRKPETTGDDLLETQVGTLAFYYGESDPPNALICDGRTIDHTDYPLLTEHLNYVKQTGKPTASISIPDCRGMFLRGFGKNSGKLGMVQEDAIRNIKGAFGQWNVSAYGPFSYGADSKIREGIKTGSTTNNAITMDVSRVVPTANENRPINIAYNIIIFTCQLKKNLRIKSLKSNILRIFTSKFTSKGGVNLKYA